MKQADEIRRRIAQIKQQVPAASLGDKAPRPAAPKQQMTEIVRQAASVKERKQQAMERVVTSGTYLEKLKAYPEAMPEISANRLQKLQMTTAAQQQARQAVEQQYRQFMNKWQKEEKQQKNRAES